MRRIVRRTDPRLAVATVAAVVPVVVAAIAALAGGWTAMGDNAQVLLRSRDVFTEHTPLVGPRSSSGLALDFEFNSPGPVLYYLFAVPARLWGDAGLVVAVAATAIASILAVAYVLNRSAGAVVAVLGLVAVTGLGWTMGRSLVIEPWQPHSLLHPFLLFLVLAWVTAAGDQRLLPWTAAVATLLVQSHLTYVYVVPTVALATVAALAIGAARVRRRDPNRWPAQRRQLGRTALATTVVLGVLWLPPLVEQLRASGRGNLARLLDAARGDAPTVGAEAGVRRAAEVLALWPTWLRPSFGQDLLARAAPGPAASITGLLVLAAITGLAGWWAWRRGDRFGLTGVVVAAVAAIAATYSASATIDTVFDVASHHIRYLWPVAIVLQLVVVVVVVRRLGPAGARRAGIVATALVVVLAAANLPDVDRAFEPSASVDLGSIVREINAQLDPLEDLGTVLVEFPSQPFAEPFSHPFVAELGHRGVDFVVRDPVSIRRYGESRTYDGHADAVVFLRWGTAALTDEPDAEPVAFASLLEDGELETWQRLREEVMTAIEGEGIRLTPEGRGAVADGRLALPVSDDGARIETRAIYVSAGAVERAVDEGWVHVPGIPARTFRQWLALEETLERSTVAVWATDPRSWSGRTGT